LHAAKEHYGVLAVIYNEPLFVERRTHKQAEQSTSEGTSYSLREVPSGSAVFFAALTEGPERLFLDWCERFANLP